jgi:hypothetical protein
VSGPVYEIGRQAEVIAGIYRAVSQLVAQASQLMLIRKNEEAGMLLSRAEKLQEEARRLETEMNEVIKGL